MTSVVDSPTVLHATVAGVRASVRTLPELDPAPAPTVEWPGPPAPQVPTPRRPAPVGAQPVGAQPVGAQPVGAQPGLGEPLPRARAELVLRLTLEVVVGRRPPIQLRRLVTGSVLRYVAAAAAQPQVRRRRADGPVPRPRAVEPGRRADAGSGLRSIRVCHPVDGVAEVSAVWRHRGRYRALAARFELVAGGGAEPGRAPLYVAPPGPIPTSAPEPAAGKQWRCTELRLG